VLRLWNKSDFAPRLSKSRTDAFRLTSVPVFEIEKWGFVSHKGCDKERVNRECDET